MAFSSWKKKKKGSSYTFVNVTRSSYEFLRLRDHHQKCPDSALLLRLLSLDQQLGHHQGAVRSTEPQAPPRALENVHFNQIPGGFASSFKFGKRGCYEDQARSDPMPFGSSGALGILGSWQTWLQIRDSSLGRTCRDQNSPFPLCPQAEGRWSLSRFQGSQSPPSKSCFLNTDVADVCVSVSGSLCAHSPHEK